MDVPYLRYSSKITIIITIINFNNLNGSIRYRHKHYNIYIYTYFI